MLQPGTLITDLEGYDLGEDGAVVVSVDGAEVELAKLDTEEIITVNLSDLAYTSEEPVKAPGVYPHLLDQEAMDSPELHLIRKLPQWWGPRDPNAPSSITDTIWRPEPLWRRQQNRYYSVEDPMPRQTKRERRSGETVAPALPPDPTGKKALETDYGLPRRMRLDLWTASSDDPLDTDALRDLASEFWLGYRSKRNTYMPGHGNRHNLPLEDYALMFQKRVGLARDEMDLLYQFMVATKVVPPWEREQYHDLLDTFEVFWFNQL